MRHAYTLPPRRGIALYGTKCHRMNPQCGHVNTRQAGEFYLHFYLRQGRKVKGLEFS